MKRHPRRASGSAWASVAERARDRLPLPPLATAPAPLHPSASRGWSRGEEAQTPVRTPHPGAPRFFELETRPRLSAGSELATMLAQPVVSTPPRLFYDALGSALFTAICELPEYYPTRTERAILATGQDAIARAAGAGSTFIDLGAGDCRKAQSLFAALSPSQYVAVDVSTDFLRDALGAVARSHPALDIVGVATDFADGLLLPSAVSPDRRLFFYAGSSIGNFDPAQALRFLRALRSQCDIDGGLLIGVDLVKPADVLVSAYDDALGVTAAFNRNLLLHVNRLLGSDFAPRDWRHLASWNAQASRIEMHLEARERLRVEWPGGERVFERGERIHTENSYKYTIDRFDSLLVQSRFAPIGRWTDARGWYAVYLARAA